MPRLIIITAIAASNIYIIFENARVPLGPKTFISASALTKVSQTKDMFNIKETKVARAPKLFIIISVVVNTAGPVIKGVPKGNTPISLFRELVNTLFCAPGNKSRTEITNKRAPPAI